MSKPFKYQTLDSKFVIELADLLHKYYPDSQLTFYSMGNVIKSVDLPSKVQIKILCHPKLKEEA